MPDRSSVADVVMHPVRLRILQAVNGVELTTADLRKTLPEVAQATLYRHVAALIDARVLTVVDERRVRGATERTLAMGPRLAHADLAELREMTDQQLRSAFVTFLGHLGSSFDRLLASDDRALRELLGFTQVQLYLSTDDLATLQTRLNELLAPYLVVRDDAAHHKLSLSTVLLPEPHT